MDSIADLRSPLAATHEPMEPVPYRVVTRAVDGPKVVTTRLLAVDTTLPIPEPGQFMMVWVFGVGEVPISVSNVTPDGALDFTVQAVGATSSAITDAQVGDVLGLRGPFGTSWPVALAGGRDVMVMAGGLGLAPLRSAIDALSRGESAARDLTVLIGAREPSGLLYPDDLVRWAASGATVRTTVDAADRTWKGDVGVVTVLLDRVLDVDALHADIAFVCGPEVMMVASVRALMKAGMTAEQIYVSLERNMHCGIAHCGRCQLGPLLLCRDGAVVRWDRVADLVAVRGR